MLIKNICKYFLVFICSGVFTSIAYSPLSHSVVKEKPPLLIYNQFPRIWNMDFKLMQEHLPKIKELGFNAVWINPFMKTSKHNVVSRTNKATGEIVKVIRSLYGMFDPSLTYNEIYTEGSVGDPSFPGIKVADDIKAYTEQARKLGLTPIFDLVLNHVSRDSPLVAGTFTHFLKQGNRYI